jgi:nucleoid-associated protein YgaU
MPKPGLETQQKIAEIEAEQRRLKALLDKQKNLLDLIEEKSLPDSQPYISFKKGTSVLDLRGPPGGIREVFKSEITRIKQQLDQLSREARIVRRHGYREYVRRERAAVARIDRQFEAHARRILRDAGARGHLTDEELVGLQKGADEILEAFTGLLQLDSSESAVRDVLSQLADTMALGGGDSAVAQRALNAVGNAAKGHLEKARQDLSQRPSEKAARQVIRAATNLELLGDSAGTAAALQQTLSWMETQRDAAEKRFRRIPSTENLKLMFQAETACLEMGGSPISSPPEGLRRVKSGDQHRIVPGDTLSGISRDYYGSFSFRDVLVRANAQHWANPDRPPTGIITIPYS